MTSVSLWMQCLLAAVLVLSAGPATAAAPVEWTSMFGGPEEEMAQSVSQLPDGGYLVGGGYLEQPVTGQRNGHTELYLARTDSGGTPLWSATFCEESAYECHGGTAVEAGDGGYLLVGTSCLSWNHLSRQIVLFKVDAGGNEEWVRHYGWPDASATSMGSYGLDIKATPDGGFIILGTTGPGTEEGVLLLKVDSSGNELWKTAAGDPGCGGAAVLAADDGGIVVAGSCFRERGSVEEYDAYILRTDALGGTEWSASWDGGGDEHGYGVCQSGDGGYVLTGYVYPADDSPSDAVVVKFDAAGMVVWASVFGGAGDDWALGITPADDGGFMVTGGRRMENYPAVVGNHLFVAKVGGQGMKKWETLLGDPLPWTGHPYSQGNAIAPAIDGGFIAAGRQRAVHGGALMQGGYDAYLVKFGPDVRAASIAIDIKPGSDRNPINISDAGKVPVALFTTGDFDAAMIDPATLSLAGAPVAWHSRGPMAALEDVDGDGDADLVAHFPVAGLSLTTADSSALLTGELYTGESVEGTDAVRVKMK